MTYLPTTVGSGPVSATIDNTVADQGLAPYPNSANQSGQTYTENLLATQLNILNVGTTPPSNAETT